MAFVDKNGKECSKGEEVLVGTVPAIVFLPENTVEVNFVVKIYQGGELYELSSKLDFDGVRNAIKDAENNYFDEDAKYVITEEGRRWLAEREKDNVD